MSTVNIWNVQWHFEAPVGTLPSQAPGTNPGFVTQMNCVQGPQRANVVSATNDPTSIAAVLDANGLTTPPGNTRVIERISPADTPQAFQ